MVGIFWDYVKCGKVAGSMEARRLVQVLSRGRQEEQGGSWASGGERGSQLQQPFALDDMA